MDPNGDGDVTDHVAVALVGVNSPYAGFTTSPEAEAVNSATNLGTLVVAPAGNEGPRRGSFGTTGSSGAASGALTVAALELPIETVHVRIIDEYAALWPGTDDAHLAA